MRGHPIAIRSAWSGCSLAVLLLIAVTAGGCSVGRATTITHNGVIGDTFKGTGGLRVTLVRYSRHVSPPPHDVTGLATPKPGTHFVAFLVRMCINTSGLPTISDRNFSVPLVGGGEAAAKFPQTVYADDLGLLGEAGCEHGHIVFQVPRGKRPSDLRFKLDISKGTTQGYSDNTNIRFDWKL